MEFAIHHSHRRRSYRSLGILCFFALLPAANPAGAAPPVRQTATHALTKGASPTLFDRSVSSNLERARVAGPPALADGWGWRNLLTSFESAFGNRRRMIQLATIGMCIGLYIMMRR